MISTAYHWNPNLIENHIHGDINHIQISILQVYFIIFQN